MTTDFPAYAVADQRVFALSFTQANTTRAFNRDLVDFRVDFKDVVSSWTSNTFVGMSSELAQDYRTSRKSVPLKWLIARFLVHHIAASDQATIAKSDGPVLMTTTYSAYLGESLQDELSDEAVVQVLQSWVRGGVQEPITLASLFASTNLSLDCLRRSMNALAALGLVSLESDDVFGISGEVVKESGGNSGRGTEPTPVSSYYQEIPIEATTPFCFVIMPFGAHEHPQRQYFDVIKPLLDSEFGITCYRVDEDALPDRIDNKIYTYMLRAEFVLAEITTANPNVMYELGMAHALNKRCILLTRNKPKHLPFDVSRITVEPYDDDDSLKAYLRRVVKALMGLR